MGFYVSGGLNRLAGRRRASGGQAESDAKEGARTHRPARAAKMFAQRAQDSVGEADTRNARDPGEKSMAARSEHSERPVAGTDAAAQAAQAGGSQPDVGSNTGMLSR